MCTISSLVIRRVGSRLSTEGPEISIYYILAPIVAARNVDTSIAIGLHTLVKNLVVFDYIYYMRHERSSHFEPFPKLDPKQLFCDDEHT